MCCCRCCCSRERRRPTTRRSSAPAFRLRKTQRCANGSPREREGWLGWLLKAMAWITLAIAPILILLVFQFMFLPYHSHLATWTHRLLILAELVLAFLLWPLVLDAQKDFDWPHIRAQIKRITTLPLRV